jgi:hypothetical protein
MVFEDRYLTALESATLTLSLQQDCDAKAFRD